MGKEGTKEVEGGVAFDMQSRRVLEAGRYVAQRTVQGPHEAELV